MTVLPTLLKDYPRVMALKRGEIKSPLVSFDFAANNVGFEATVRDLAYECSEMPMSTLLQAKANGCPYVLMPVVVFGRLELHGVLAYNPERGPLTPSDLRGKRIGIASYSQTSVVWIRSILQHDYGVDLSRVHWVTFRPSFIPSFRDPDNCTPAPAGKKLEQMLVDGELDAGVITSATDPNLLAQYPPLRRLIPDPAAASLAWHKRHGVMPINHALIVREQLAKSRPDIVREIYRMFVESKKAGPREELETPFGFNANRKAIQMVIDYAWEQGVIQRRMEAEELFDDTTRVLGN